MTEQSVMPELDVFNLPVFADANIWAMWPDSKLAELADDIRENGFDHRYPLTIAEIEGVWMLLDGRNRREAARMAGMIPPVIITDVDPKLAVHRSNNQNRDATPGQKAMAFAMQFPEAFKVGRKKKGEMVDSNNQFDKSLLSRARYVLRNNPTPEGQQYPDRCRAIMDGSLSLTEAYEKTQEDVKCREEEARIREEHKAKLDDIRTRYPDLAALVDDERITLGDAIASAESRDRQAAEQERRQREEEEARLAEAERRQREAERLAREDYERRRAGFFEQLYYFINSTSIAANETQIKQLDRYVERKEWEAFSQKYRCQKRETLETLRAFANNLPVLIDKLERM